ncbi:MAG TPA: hypothetical protein VN634_17695 [Candidatus Limnocylindrales bacterium]|nr:hypothetical protein [Candidatus Limnocylindrales bacterium]
MHLPHHWQRAFAQSLFALAAILASPLPARACDLCSIYTGSLLQQHKTGLLLGVAEQYTLFGTVRVDGKKVPNEANEWVHSSITQLLVGYTFTPRIGVQMNVPLISRQYRRLEEGSQARGDVGGLGDLSIVGRVSPFSRAIGQLLVNTELLAGLKLPTGSSHRLGEEHEHEDGGDEEEALALALPSPHHEEHEEHEESAVHGHDLTLGSGSVDGLFGASVHASWQRLFGDLAAQYVVRGNGDFSYEYANDLTWEASIGYYVVAADRWTASLALATSGENKGRDHQHGELQDDTAITAVYLGPGASVTWTDALHAGLVIEAPLEQDNTGRQIVADYRIRGGLTWRF